MDCNCQQNLHDNTGKNGLNRTSQVLSKNYKTTLDRLNAENLGFLPDLIDKAADITERTSDSSDAASIIMWELRYNDWDDVSWFNPNKYIQDETISLNDVEAILDTYANLMQQDKSLVAYTAEDKEAADQWHKLIAEKSTQNESMAGRVMPQLYWATIQNRMPNQSFLYPRKAEENKQYLVPTEENKAEGIFSYVLGVPIWRIGLGLAATGLFLFLGAKIISDVKSIAD